MWPFGNKKEVKELQEKTEKSFELVKQDIESVGKWLKHLDSKDKQLFDSIFLIKEEISTIREELESLREGLTLKSQDDEVKQVFKKLPVLSKQTADEDVQEIVQTAVQTDNIYGILNKLSGNERVIVLALMNSDMKLSYEDLALLLGKERSTIRGQINAIKQKSEGLIEELTEKNGKKRVYIPEEIKEKMQKYAKVRVGKEKKEVKRTQKE
jgi:biotin operon repressor